MKRKMLLIAAAVAMPLGAIGVTTIAGSTVAGASNSTALNITCKISGAAVTFAGSGLSANGTITSLLTSTTTTSAQKLTCGTAGKGSSPGLSIVTNNEACTAVDTPEIGCPAPPPQMYDYGSVAGFAASSGTLAGPTGSIPHITAKIGTTTYMINTTVSSVALTCGTGEAGFSIHGKIATPLAHKGEKVVVTACLGADTHTGSCNTTPPLNMFATDLGLAGCYINTAALAADSKVKIS